jgi:hypothetical protein
MTNDEPIVVKFNPNNDTWDVGWLDPEVGFVPHFCGYATKKEAEAQIPGFDVCVEREFKEYQAKVAAKERRQNAEFPNLANVRSMIKKIKDPERHFDALQKLDWLLDLDLTEHIRWPLPSWKAIKSGRVYGR